MRTGGKPVVLRHEKIASDILLILLSEPIEELTLSLPPTLLHYAANRDSDLTSASGVGSSVQFAETFLQDRPEVTFMFDR